MARGLLLVDMRWDRIELNEGGGNGTKFRVDVVLVSLRQK